MWNFFQQNASCDGFQDVDWMKKIARKGHSEMFLLNEYVNDPGERSPNRMS